MAARMIIGILCICTIFAEISADDPTPRYKVSLDDDPEVRWKDISLKYGGETLREMVAAVIRDMVPAFAVPLIEEIADHLEDFIAEPYASEIRGFSKYLNVSLGDIVLGNLMYEIVAYCTSIVAQNEDGTIWHARNLDFPYSEYLRNLTYMVDFTKDNKTLYTATTFLSYVGVLTGQKPGAFTISLDERHEGAAWINVLAALFEKNSSPVSFLIREVLGDPLLNYTSAVDKLASTHLIAPTYLIIAGTKPDEGAIITRDRLKAVDVWSLNCTAGHWFEVETNYDHWEPAGDGRRDVANKLMTKIGQKNINGTTMYGLLSTPPVEQKSTVYTTVMTAAHPSIYSSYIRYP